MTPDLSAKTALVTGASRGIGLAVAQLLHERGCRVAINGRNVEDLRKAASGMSGALSVLADVTRPDEAKRMVAETLAAFGKMDILVCNVGSGRSVPPGAESFEEWRRVLDLNLHSTTNAVESARDALAESRGSIVCISSICGAEVVPGAPVTYSVAKAALNAYVRGIARPLGKMGVRINAVAPGNILFPGSVWERKLLEGVDAVNAMLKREVALQRLGTPRDIAELVAFLVSDQSNFATGAIWTLDGGQMRH